MDKHDRRTALACGLVAAVAGSAGARSQTKPAIHHVDVAGYPAAHSPYSHAVVANGFVFVSGQIPVRPGGGPTEVVGETMQEQTRHISPCATSRPSSKPPGARSTAW